MSIDAYLWAKAHPTELIITPFVTAFMESRLLGTQHVEDAFRWLGIHDATLQLLHWLLL